MRSLTLGFSSTPRFLSPRLTHPLETVCILLLDLVVALAKFLLVFFLSLEETLVRAIFLSLSESFSLTIIHDVFSLLISAFLLFSQVGKPVLDSVLQIILNLELHQSPLYLSTFPLLSN